MFKVLEEAAFARHAIERVEFHSQLDIRKVDGTVDNFTLLHSMECTVEMKAGYAVGNDGTIVHLGDKQKRAYVFVVPEGFQCDLSSIPGAMQSFISKVGRYDKPSVFHDWLYENKYWKPFADACFFHGMTTMGVSEWKKEAMYQAVVAFGEKEWED